MDRNGSRRGGAARQGVQMHVVCRDLASGDEQRRGLVVMYATVKGSEATGPAHIEKVPNFFCEIESVVSTYVREMHASSL